MGGIVILTRRRAILSTVSFIPVCVLAGGCSRLPTNSTSDLDIVARILEFQIPLSGVGNAVYKNIASNPIEASQSDQALADAISSATSSLGEANWMEQSEEEQLDQLQNWSSEPWFFFINFRANGLFFEHPDVWASIEYDGPSIENGGYKYNGFDDISWLPAGSK